MKATNQLFTENNKKLLENIMSKEEGVIYCNSVIDPKEEDTNKSFEELTFEEYHKKMFDEGYICADGAPKKCLCGCSEFKEVNIYRGEGCTEEYSLQCTNEKCLKIVGTWSYGNWLL